MQTLYPPKHKAPYLLFQSTKKQYLKALLELNANGKVLQGVKTLIYYVIVTHTGLCHHRLGQTKHCVYTALGSASKVCSGRFKGLLALGKGVCFAAIK